MVWLSTTYIVNIILEPRVSVGYEEYLKCSSRSTVTHLADGSEAGARFDEQDSVITRRDRQATHWVNATAAESSATTRGPRNVAPWSTSSAGCE